MNDVKPLLKPSSGGNTPSSSEWVFFEHLEEIHAILTDLKHDACPRPAMLLNDPSSKTFRLVFSCIGAEHGSVWEGLGL